MTLSISLSLSPSLLLSLSPCLSLSSLLKSAGTTIKGGIISKPLEGGGGVFTRASCSTVVSVPVSVGRYGTVSVLRAYRNSISERVSRKPGKRFSAASIVCMNSVVRTDSTSTADYFTPFLLHSTRR